MSSSDKQDMRTSDEKYAEVHLADVPVDEENVPSAKAGSSPIGRADPAVTGPRTAEAPQELAAANRRVITRRRRDPTPELSAEEEEAKNEADELADMQKDGSAVGREDLLDDLAPGGKGGATLPNARQGGPLAGAGGEYGNLDTLKDRDR